MIYPPMMGGGSTSTGSSGGKSGAIQLKFGKTGDSISVDPLEGTPGIVDVNGTAVEITSQQTIARTATRLEGSTVPINSNAYLYMDTTGTLAHSSVVPVNGYHPDFSSYRAIAGWRHANGSIISSDAICPMVGVTSGASVRSSNLDLTAQDDHLVFSFNALTLVPGTQLLIDWCLMFKHTGAGAAYVFAGELEHPAGNVVLGNSEFSYAEDAPHTITGKTRVDSTGNFRYMPLRLYINKPGATGTLKVLEHSHLTFQRISGM